MSEAMEGLEHGIEPYLGEVESATDAGFYRLALMGALTVPDIMAALDSEDGVTNGARYKEWFEDNARHFFETDIPDLPDWLKGKIRELPKPELVFDGEACWSFRCAFLHQARTEHPAGFDNIVFVEPGASTNTFHLNYLGKVLNIDLRIFCASMVQAAREWLAEHHTDPQVQKNLARVARRREAGGGGIGGVPVIM